jgi:hypothetical protein
MLFTNIPNIQGEQTPPILQTTQPIDVLPEKPASKISALNVGEKDVLVNFNGGFLSSDAGSLLLREVDEQIGLIRKMADVIPDSRDASYITHTINDLLIQRVTQIACGYEDADDCDTLRDDPIFKMIAGRYPEFGEALASQPTMSRFENSVSRTTLYRVARVFADMFLASYEEAPDVIILDVDDTVDPVYGEQQLTLFNNYYKEQCYLPLHVSEGYSGKLVTTILKPGKRCTGAQMLAIMTRLIAHLRKAWPKTIIVVRGDSHFAYPEVMDWIETQEHVHSVTGLSGNARLEKHVEFIVERAQSRYRHASKGLDGKPTPVKLFHSFEYQADSWSKARRVIAKVDVNEKGVNLRFVVTDFRGGKPSEIYNEFYCARGNMELYIKEHKRYLKSDRLSCHEFEANHFRLFLHSAAYVLIHTLKTTLLKHTEYATASIETIQLRLLKIGARIRECKTRIVVELPSHYPLKALLLRSFQILQHLRSAVSLQ